MSKLFFAGLQRLIKSKALWICCGFMLLMAVYLALASNDNEYPPDDWYYTFGALVPILTSAVMSLLLGAEYGDGTIRNKIIVGHKRGAVYIANLLLAFVSALVICASYALPYICVGIPVLGVFNAGALQVVCQTLCILAMSFAFSSLFVLISMLCQSKAITAVLCILLAVILLFAGVYIHSMLNEPEFYDQFEMMVDGQVMEYESEPNANYLRGTKRQVYEFLYDFLPGGQAVQLVATEEAHMPVLPLYDFIVITLSTAIGLWVFKKKDIR